MKREVAEILTRIRRDMALLESLVADGSAEPASGTRSKWVILADAAAHLDVHIETVWRRAVRKRANSPISDGLRMVLRSALEAGDLGVPACDRGRLHGKR